MRSSGATQDPAGIAASPAKAFPHKQPLRFPLGPEGLRWTRSSRTRSGAPGRAAVQRPSRGSTRASSPCAQRSPHSTLSGPPAARLRAASLPTAQRCRAPADPRTARSPHAEQADGRCRLRPAASVGSGSCRGSSEAALPLAFVLGRHWRCWMRLSTQDVRSARDTRGLRAHRPQRPQRRRLPTQRSPPCPQRGCRKSSLRLWLQQWSSCAALTPGRQALRLSWKSAKAGMRRTWRN
mmetsp:Transcript_47460/g.141721  ORF Transcript_47460/g.141721 Transcript_47460/m.141721 type:complete len:237 (-) Transcript_47460:417-1127(-)